jgi:hypothetical protein
MEEMEEELEEGEKEKEKEIDLTPGILSRTDDPVRLYLKEMGSVPLLSREGEIEIAKRIEEGKRDIASVVFAMPMTIKEMLYLGDQLKKERRAYGRSYLSLMKSSRKSLNRTIKSSPKNNRGDPMFADCTANY